MRLKIFLTKIRFQKKVVGFLLPTVLVAVGTYLLLLTLAPSLPPAAASPEAVKVFQDTPPEAKENRLFIPKISVDMPIVEGDSSEALDKGVWHRKPQNGNPEKGGNFVLSAHRFDIGLTPGQTRMKSPFYHIDKLEVGDEMFVDYNQKRFSYHVTKKYKVARTAVEIEAPSEAAKMTLYSCDLHGEAAGREVIEATPL